MIEDILGTSYTSTFLVTDDTAWG